jgi:hypothetical protein
MRQPITPTAPSVVYKYLPPERIDVLESSLLRFTPPVAFNDPFETSAFGTEFLRPETRRRLTTRLSGGRSAGGGDIADLLARPIDQLLAGGEIADLVPHSIDQLLAKGYQERQAESFGKAYGILSLSGRKDSLLMWAHYARSHTGLAVGFDAGNPFFAQTRSESGKRVLRPVAYRSERPRVDHRGRLNDDVFFTKSPEWEYEMEWRAILPLDEAHAKHPPEADGEPIHLFHIPEAARVEVVLGARIAAQDRDRAMSALSGKSDSSCRVFQARLSESRYELTFVLL